MVKLKIYSLKIIRNKGILLDKLVSNGLEEFCFISHLSK